jgi:hypothetical protein
MRAAAALAMPVAPTMTTVARKMVSMCLAMFMMLSFEGVRSMRRWCLVLR